jgi:hypothetical protein
MRRGKDEGQPLLSRAEQTEWGGLVLRRGTARDGKIHGRIKPQRPAPRHA